MGSYTKVNGNFTLATKITKETLIEIEKECEIFGGFMQEASARLSAASARKSLKDRYIKFSAEWKGFDDNAALDTVKQLYAAFTKRGVKIVRGVMLCDHEYGEKWKVDISENMITLMQGEVVYKPTKHVKVQVTEEITKKEIVSFV
jgi:hypothetical protein